MRLYGFALAFIALFAIPAYAVDVGDSRDFWVWDLSVMPPENVKITATCRGVGKYAYIFVEDEAWANGEMDDADVASILNAFENETPPGSYNSEMGIYEIETELFGNPTDVDNDPKIYLLYYDLKCFEGTCFDGFFRYEDLFNTEHSNFTEMLHLNINANNPASDYMMGIIAHEFNHLIHAPKDPDELMWVSESIAEAAMIACGYFTDSEWLDDYLANSQTSFWGGEYSVNYGAALLFGTYLYEILGAENISSVINNQNNGIAGIKDVLEQYEGISFEEFFGSLALSILLDNANGNYRFDLLDIKKPAHFYFVTKTDVLIEKSIEAGSIHFIHFSWYDKAPIPFLVRFEDAQSVENLLAYLVIYRGQEIEVIPIEPSTPSKVQDETADSVDFVIANPLSSGSIPYAYTVVTEGLDGDNYEDGDDDSGKISSSACGCAL